MDINNINDLKGMLNSSAPTQTAIQQGSSATGYTCSVCNASIEEKVAKYSQNRFKRPLCMECQRKEASNSQGNSGMKCDNCGMEVPTVVVEFCKNNTRFGGKVYCRECQGKVQKASTGGKCSACGTDIDGAVAKYSQTKYGKYLCRNCQEMSRSNNQPMQTENPAPTSEEKCQHCGKNVPSNVAQFSKEHLKGRIYCLDCQRELKAAIARKREAEAQKQKTIANVVIEEKPSATDVRTCSRCNTEIDQKTADYSAAHFNGKLYCRECQQKARAWAEKCKEERMAAGTTDRASSAETTTSPSQVKPIEKETATEYCTRCKKEISIEIAERSKIECDGRVYCEDCQKAYKEYKVAKSVKGKVSNAPEENDPLKPTVVAENDRPVRKGSVKDLLDNYDSGDVRRYSIEDYANLDFLTDNVFPYDV